MASEGLLLQQGVVNDITTSATRQVIEDTDSEDSHSRSSNLGVQEFKNVKRPLVLNSATLAARVHCALKNNYLVMAPEPPKRSRSYRDIIMQEMSWMAVDYYHERRWKRHAGKQISLALVQKQLDRKRNRIDWAARETSEKIASFWSNPSRLNLSRELTSYCMLVSCGAAPLEFTREEHEIETYKQDVIAISVPVHATSLPSQIAAEKVQVTSTVLDWMESMGTEYYKPIFRPPNEKSDCFTLPALDPLRCNDFNSLLVGNFIKNNIPAPEAIAATVASGKVSVSVATTSTSTSNAILAPQGTYREEDFTCLAFNLTDLLQSRVPLQQFVKTALKWEDATPASDSDANTSIHYNFGLLDDWMLKEPLNANLVATALSLLSSSGGLYPVEYCSGVLGSIYKRCKYPPRSIFNSSRKLLGPKQQTNIFAFNQRWNRMQRFKRILSMHGVARTSDADDSTLVNGGTLPFGGKQVYSAPLKWFKLLEPVKAFFTSGGYRLYNPSSVNVQGDANLIANGSLVVIPRTTRQEVLLQCNKLQRAVRLNVPCTAAGNFEYNGKVLSYTDLSYCINKQLRIGFFGIPAKIFINSLFYSGRICCKDSRVKRVATVIAAAPKYVSQQIHMLYSKMFEADLANFKSLGNVWDKQGELNMDEHVPVLLARYRAATGDKANGVNNDSGNGAVVESCIATNTSTRTRRRCIGVDGGSGKSNALVEPCEKYKTSNASGDEEQDNYGNGSGSRVNDDNEERKQQLDADDDDDDEEEEENENEKEVDDEDKHVKAAAVNVGIETEAQLLDLLSSVVQVALELDSCKGQGFLDNAKNFTIATFCATATMSNVTSITAAAATTSATSATSTTSTRNEVPRQKRRLASSNVNLSNSTVTTATTTATAATTTTTTPKRRAVPATKSSVNNTSDYEANTSDANWMMMQQQQQQQQQQQMQMAQAQAQYRPWPMYNQTGHPPPPPQAHPAQQAQQHPAQHPQQQQQQQALVGMYHPMVRMQNTNLPSSSAASSSSSACTNNNNNNVMNEEQQVYTSHQYQQAMLQQQYYMRYHEQQQVQAQQSSSPPPQPPSASASAVTAAAATTTTTTTTR